MSRQTTTHADIQRAPTRSGGERARAVDDDHAEAPLQLMTGPGVGTTALSALMAAGGNVQMAQLSHPVQRSADKDGGGKEGADEGGEDKLRLVVSVLENKLGRELKGADVKIVRDQLQGREAEPTPELVRDLLPMLGGEAPVQQRAAGAVQRSGAGGEDTGAVHAAAARGIAGGGGSLPYAEQIQQSFGRHDVSGIKGHVGGPAREASEAMGAEAYATGDHVAFKGQPDLHTAAHEAAHVVQQRAGVSLKGGVGQVGDAYERHADAVADRVVQGKSAEDLLDTMAGGGARDSTSTQRSQRRKMSHQDTLRLSADELSTLTTTIGALSSFLKDSCANVLDLEKELKKTAAEMKLVSFVKSVVPTISGVLLSPPRTVMSFIEAKKAFVAGIVVDRLDQKYKDLFAVFSAIPAIASAPPPVNLAVLAVALGGRVLERQSTALNEELRGVEDAARQLTAQREALRSRWTDAKALHQVLLDATIARGGVRRTE